LRIIKIKSSSVGKKYSMAALTVSNLISSEIIKITKSVAATAAERVSLFT
jgi:hypothetical protein